LDQTIKVSNPALWTTTRDILPGARVLCSCSCGRRRRLAHRNFAAHCSNIERPGVDTSLPARILYSFGQSAQGRGVCAGTAQVSRSSPPVRATHVGHGRERAIERLGGGGGRLWREPPLAVSVTGRPEWRR